MGTRDLKEESFPMLNLYIEVICNHLALHVLVYMLTHTVILDLKFRIRF